MVTSKFYIMIDGFWSYFNEKELTPLIQEEMKMLFGNLHIGIASARKIVVVAELCVVGMTNIRNWKQRRNNFWNFLNVAMEKCILDCKAKYSASFSSFLANDSFVRNINVLSLV